MTATLCPATLLARLERSAASLVITSRHHLDRGDARLVLEDPGGKECHELFRAIRRSTTLLGDRAQALLSALAVFHSPATLDAIEAVTGRPIDLDGLSELVEAHLVDPTHGSGGSRYRLPALVRESATELLEAQPGRADELRARHTEWAASVAQESRDLEDSGRRDSALALVAAVEADLVAALVRVTDFASSTGAPGRTGSSWSSAPHAPHGTDGMAPVIRLTPSLGAGGLDRPLLQDLTEREREVLTSMTSGATNKELSGLLGISAKTVMHHTSSIYRKLGVRGRSEAVAWALRNPYAVPAPTGSPHRAERGARRERLSAKGI
jgi:DNA-binding CsgD family transcriptional regulator